MNLTPAVNFTERNFEIFERAPQMPPALADCAAASLCEAIGREWSAFIARRSVLRAAPCAARR